MLTKEAWQSTLEQRYGKALQQRFSRTCVAACGLGGLGSHAANALARAGIGTLLLVDSDKVELSNLHRQQYKATQIGKYKTEALRENLLEFAPYCRILTQTVRLTEENAGSILADADIICEAFDNPECKAMLVNTISEQFPEKYIVAASGMAGLHTGNTIRTRRLTEHLYLCGDESSDVTEEGTLFAPRVMLCAAHQANTILRLIAGLE